MKEQTRSKHTHSDLSQEKQQCNQQRRPTGAARRGTRTLKQNQLRAQENHSTSNVGDRGGAKRGETHSSKTNSEPKKTTEHPTKATEGEQREGRHTHSSKRTRPQYSQQRRPRETYSKPLRKTEMKRVRNDLTDTAIGTPLTLEKTAPAPRPKSLKKRR